MDEFDDLLETYRRKKSDYSENDLGENMILDKLIVMDDVSGLDWRNLPTFLLFHENMDCHVFTFFTPYTRQDRIRK